MHFALVDTPYFFACRQNVVILVHHFIMLLAFLIKKRKFSDIKNIEPIF